MKKLIAEFIGTFFLVLVASLSNNALAIGLTLTVMVYTFGYISGGHFNPAVTIGMLINKKIRVDDAIRYIISQFLGGFIASLVYYILTTKFFSLGIQSGNTFLAALLIEAIFTFALVTVILHTTKSENQYFGLAIGLTIFIASAAGGAISGGAFNPAVGVAPLILNITQIGNNLGNIVLYILGPILGGSIAAFLFKYFNDELKIMFK